MLFIVQHLVYILVVVGQKREGIHSITVLELGIAEWAGAEGWRQWVVGVVGVTTHKNS